MVNEKISKVVVAGTSVYGIENLGDEAMLHGFLKNLKKNLPKVEVTLLARHPSEKLDKFFGVNTIANLEHESTEASQGRWFNGLNKGDSTEHLKLIAKKIEEADLLVIGGDPFNELSLAFYRGLAPYAALLTTIAKFVQTPVMLYGIHMGRPLETDIGKEYTKFCIENADFVTLREKFSKDVLSDMGIVTEHCNILADTAFALDPIIGKEKGQEILNKESILFDSEKVIGVTFRHQYWNWGKENWGKYSAMLAEVFDYMIEKTGAEILFIPNCTYSVDKDYKDDRITHKDIVSKMKHKDRTHQVAGKYDLFETLSLFAHIDLMFSNRRHSLIFSAVMGVPPVGCGGKWHIKPAMDELGVGDVFVPLEELTAERLKISLKTIWDNRTDIAIKMKKVIPELRELANAHGKIAADFIKEGK